jgi:hypothetical protein
VKNLSENNDNHSSEMNKSSNKEMIEKQLLSEMNIDENKEKRKRGENKENKPYVSLPPRAFSQ